VLQVTTDQLPLRLRTYRIFAWPGRSRLEHEVGWRASSLENGRHCTEWYAMPPPRDTVLYTHARLLTGFDLAYHVYHVDFPL